LQANIDDLRFSAPAFLRCRIFEPENRFPLFPKMLYFADCCQAGFNSYTAVAAIMLVGGRLTAKLFHRH
jgi:hypothetical protein